MSASDDAGHSAGHSAGHGAGNSAGEGARQWRLHVGAHKTATTHLQARLDLVRDRLEAEGVGLALPDQLRPVRALDLRRRRLAVWYGRAPLRRDIEARLAPRVALLPRMVLSEEDILGNATAPLHPGFYPRAGKRVGALASALLAGGQGGIWLSVRSLEQFLPAAYGTALKHVALPFDAAAFKARVLARPPDWSALVARLVRAAPGVPITVWDYADYRANSAAIFADLTGVALSDLPDVPDPVSTQTPTAAAIHAAEALPAIRDPHARAARIGEIYEAATGPRFTLFSKEEAALLKAQHRAQMDRLRALPNVRFLTF